MPLLINLRHLEAHNLRLAGELPVQELDIDPHDEVIRVEQPLNYDVEVQKVEDGLLVQGRLQLALECQCVRCLKSFQAPLVLDRWACLVPLQGEDAVPIHSDCVDLTPTVREDILLEFPQHPVCDPDCGGLLKTSVSTIQNGGNAGKTEIGSPAWAELNKLKL
jgi:uncharacterized protein